MVAPDLWAKQSFSISRLDPTGRRIRKRSPPLWDECQGELAGRKCGTRVGRTMARSEKARYSSIRRADFRLGHLVAHPGVASLDHIPACAGWHLGLSVPGCRARLNGRAAPDALFLYHGFCGYSRGERSWGVTGFRGFYRYLWYGGPHLGCLRTTASRDTSASTARMDLAMFLELRFAL